MEIDYSVTIDYGEDGPDEGEPTPSEDDISTWIVEGMARHGFTSAEGVVTNRQ